MLTVRMDGRSRAAVVVMWLALSAGGCAERDMPAAVSESAPVPAPEKDRPYNPLSAEEALVILQKGTEPPFVGEYTRTMDRGTYVCRRCNAPLYRSENKFAS